MALIIDIENEFLWLDLHFWPQEVGRDDFAHVQHLLWCDEATQLVCLSLLDVTCIVLEDNRARRKLVVLKITK